MTGFLLCTRNNKKDKHKLVFFIDFIRSDDTISLAAVHGDHGDFDRMIEGVS